MARKPQHSSEDSAYLHAAIAQIMDNMGRGGLSFVARETGMTPSALRKRMLRPDTAFDGPTLRAAILVMELRRGARPPEPAEDTQAPEAEEDQLPDHQ